jgi:transcriptional regulator with XRE-family HTH domain
MNKERLGRQIKILRAEQGLNQKALAMILEVEPHSLSNWETGKLPIPTTQLVKLCELYNLSLSYFDSILEPMSKGD